MYNVSHIRSLMLGVYHEMISRIHSLIKRQGSLYLTFKKRPRCELQRALCTHLLG